MIQTTITNDILNEARNKSKEMGVLRNSITRGGGNVYGFAGELVACRYLQDAVVRNTHDYDLVMPKEKSWFKIDVKTKKVTSAPKDAYLCSVADYNTKQECDAYLFTRVKDDFSYAWLLGWMLKHEFYKKAKLYKEGEIDPGGNGKWRFRADCFNIEISKLRPIETLRGFVEEHEEVIVAAPEIADTQICRHCNQSTGQGYTCRRCGGNLETTPEATTAPALPTAS